MSLLLVFLLLFLGGRVWAADVQQVKGVFESCPACKLDSMPELKRFFHESVLKGEYGDKLTVKFIPGATPKLILYGADDKEISREDIDDKLNFAQIHKWVQGKGFAKVAAAAAGPSTDSTAAVSTTAAAPTPAGTPSNPAAAATEDSKGLPRPRERREGPVQRRRRLNPVMRGQRRQGAGAAAAGGQGDGAQGGIRRRRRRQAAGNGGAYGGGDGKTTRMQMRVRRRRRRAAEDAGPAGQARL